MVIETYAFWRDATERVIRAGVQAATPIFVGLSATGAKIDVTAVTVAVGTVTVLTLLKLLAGIQSSETSPALVRIADRVGAAVATSFIAFIPTAATLDGWSHIPWATAGLSAVGGAGLALIMLYGAPPTQEKPA